MPQKLKMVFPITYQIVCVARSEDNYDFDIEIDLKDIP